ncbi:hypothetical protein M8J76_011435 [Diaphorina citri]|nr:hypothetical protein M8J76_011435 [Diaphorina citri]
MIQNGGELSDHSTSYITCVKHFDDLLFYCQQYPCPKEITDFTSTCLQHIYQGPLRNDDYNSKYPGQIQASVSHKSTQKSLSEESVPSFAISRPRSKSPLSQQCCSGGNRSIRNFSRRRGSSWDTKTHKCCDFYDLPYPQSPDKSPSNEVPSKCAVFIMPMTHDEVKQSPESTDITSTLPTPQFKDSPYNSPAESTHLHTQKSHNTSDMTSDNFSPPVLSPIRSLDRHNGTSSPDNCSRSSPDKNGSTTSPDVYSPIGDSSPVKPYYLRKHGYSCPDPFGSFVKPYKSNVEKYDGFYSAYCKSCNCCRCRKTCPELDLIGSYFLSKCKCYFPKKATEKPPKECCPKKDFPPKKEHPQKSDPCSPRRLKSDSLKLCPRSKSYSDEKSQNQSSLSSDRSRSTQMATSSGEICCQSSEYQCYEDRDNCDIHVLESTPTLQNQSPVEFTSTIMVLFFVMMAIYTVGLNIGEYITYTTGLHGRTFFLIPYMLRSVTIGFVLMTDFLAFLMCPNSMVGYVDLAFRTFMFAFLAAAFWNIVEFAMESRHVDPILYFATSVLVCLLAMFSFFRFVNRNT